MRAQHHPFLLAAVVALAILSGCVSRPPVSGADDAGDATAKEPSGLDAGETLANQTLRHFNGTFTLHLSEVTAGTAHVGVPPPAGVATNNCIAIGGEPTVVAGHAVATWTALSPAHDQLMVHVAYGTTGEAAETGPSGVRLDLSGITLEGVTDLGGTGDGGNPVALLSINIPEPAGAAVDQQVTLELVLDYTADDDINVIEGYTCQPL